MSTGFESDLLVISNVVPKIWARTNSAMMAIWGRKQKGEEWIAGGEWFRWRA